MKTITQYTIHDDSYILFSYSDQDFKDSFLTYNGVFQLYVTKKIRMAQKKAAFRKKYNDAVKNAIVAAQTTGLFESSFGQFKAIPPKDDE